MAVATKVRRKHKWSDEEKASLIEAIAGAQTPKARQVILKRYAKRIGNGITPASVQAQYYQFRNAAGHVPTPRAAAPKAAAKTAKAPKAAVKAPKAAVKKPRTPNGLKPVQQQLHTLQANVSRLERELEAAVAAESTYRTELAKLVG